MRAIRARRPCLNAPTMLVAALTAVLIALAPVPRARGAESAYSEDQVKAAYLYRVAGYVEWPAAAASSATAFVIAVYDAPAVLDALRQILPGHSINGLPAEAREINGPRDLAAAQLIYAGPGRASALRRMLPASGLPSVLFVTDEEDGLTAGSALNFLTIDRRVRFEVSLTAADRAGLKISSELLSLAIRVEGGGRQSREGCAVDAPRFADRGSTPRVFHRDAVACG